MNTPNQNKPQLPPHDLDEPEPPPTFGRFLVLCLYAVLAFVAWVAIAIAAGSNLFPRSVRLVLSVIALAPIAAALLYMVLDALVALLETFFDIKAAIGPMTRRKKFVAAMIASIIICAFSAGRFWLRLESDRHNQRAAVAPLPHPQAAPPPATQMTKPTLPAQTADPAKAPTTSAIDAARALHDMINNSPPIIPSTTTQPAPR